MYVFNFSGSQKCSPWTSSFQASPWNLSEMKILGFPEDGGVARTRNLSFNVVNNCTVRICLM